MRVGLYDDPIFREHDSGAGHPERPERLEAVREGLGGATMVSTEILSARIELSISSSYTDEDRPAEAEEKALAAVKRLEAFENTIERRLGEEADPAVRTRLERSVRQVRRMRSNALLSLAVNANVRTPGKSFSSSRSPSATSWRPSITIMTADSSKRPSLRRASVVRSAGAMVSVASTRCWNTGDTA